MAGTLRDLAQFTRQVASELPQRANANKQQTTLAMAEHLIVSTPVDTSKALSNWQIGQGAPPQPEDIPPHVPGKHGSTYAASRSQGISNARQQVTQAAPGKPLYLSNAAPYIETLDGGSSSQAPQGFTDTAMTVGKVKSDKVGLQYGTKD